MVLKVDSLKPRKYIHFKSVDSKLGGMAFATASSKVVASSYSSTGVPSL